MNALPVIHFSLRKRHSGQAFAAFLLLFFMILMGFFLMGDLSRVMIAMNKAQDLADNAALAAAGAADARMFSDGSLAINVPLAELRARTVVDAWLVMRYPNENFMHLSLSGLSIDDREVIVTVSGSVEAVFGKFLGFESFPISRTAHARLIYGIIEEIK
jgi:hypothetical protein